MADTSYPYNPKTTVPKIKFEKFDNANFAYMLWESSLDITKARILLVHGFGEYTKIYYRMMDQLSSQGYESFFFDQRGSGETSPGKLKGKTNEHFTFSDLEHFVSKNLEECKKKNIKLFMWGHSMGGGICLNYACTGKSKDQFQGFIASGPLIILHPNSRPNKVTQMISPLLAKTMPNFTIDTGLNLEGITSDPTYREFLANDPMSVPLLGSFRQIYDFLERGKALYNNKDNRISKITKPIFIQHGKDDTINDPKGSQNFYDNCKFNDKRLVLYENGRHSILSLEIEEVFDKALSDLVEWLDAHL
ncbi:hypothetical protein TBLA_0B05550 [Henningerozyma blattae CBS 6284]|uniref:Serine aminopeptidase S33 domain-containing protein n=1 Tax=Henningerozyma blattae (strain ATCC 34711 / CBS 6284 / DSM 70876 / NBRC 10599 / NRRL Y-10934 / UCD 77-7) TaxID=1071380 RepID=I2GZ31_HENB6|nr:hypothetical protein TBLA_0B05550 [Tetrapisispora blattae CBS 6284]CCH59383.1 hypothetical protein TBLA_0B05550 [Tetrapisispora blattae CBS 6284]